MAHILWVLKRTVSHWTVSMWWFFWAPKTYVKTDKLENIHYFTLNIFFLSWYIFYTCLYSITDPCSIHLHSQRRGPHLCHFRAKQKGRDLLAGSFSRAHYWNFNKCKLLFSSPEPKAHGWANIIPVTLASIHLSMNIFKHLLLWNHGTGPIKLKFYIETP